MRERGGKKLEKGGKKIKKERRKKRLFNNLFCCLYLTSNGSNCGVCAVARDKFKSLTRFMKGSIGFVGGYFL